MEENEVTKAMKKLIFEAPEFYQRVREIAAEVQPKPEQKRLLTCNELAEILQKCTRTVYYMSKEELEKAGYIRKKIGVSVRFERINPPGK